MFKPVEGGVGLLDLVQMYLQSLAHIKALGAASESRQFIEAGFHLVGDADCQHGASLAAYCLYDKYNTETVRAARIAHIALRVALCYLMFMSQPVKLSDALVLDARIAGEAQERSITGQVEFWAKLGRSMELLLEGRQVLTLCRTVGATPLADLVDLVDTPAGHEMLKTYLDSEPYPHFEAHPSQTGLLVRIEQDGSRTVGRFINRAFIPVPLEEELRANSSVQNENAAEPVSA